jgi:hypothetical protein
MMARWAADFPAEQPSAYDDEAAAVVRSLIAGPYPQFGEVPLTSVADAAPHEVIAGDTATALLRNLQLSPTIDIRTLLAAAGLAFARNPQTYQARNVTQKVLEHAHVIETRGVRAARPVVPQAERDRAAGQSLLALITA